MANDIDHPFSDKSVCMALVQHGLITREQALEIFEKKEKVRFKKNTCYSFVCE